MFKVFRIFGSRVKNNTEYSYIKHTNTVLHLAGHHETFYVHQNPFFYNSKNLHYKEGKPDLGIQ